MVHTLHVAVRASFNEQRQSESMVLDFFGGGPVSATDIDVSFLLRPGWEEEQLPRDYRGYAGLICRAPTPTSAAKLELMKDADEIQDRWPDISDDGWTWEELAEAYQEWSTPKCPCCNEEPLGTAHGMVEDYVWIPGNVKVKSRCAKCNNPACGECMRCCSACSVGKAADEIVVHCADCSEFVMGDGACPCPLNSSPISSRLWYQCRAGAPGACAQD